MNAERNEEHETMIVILVWEPSFSIQITCAPGLTWDEREEMSDLAERIIEMINNE